MAHPVTQHPPSSLSFATASRPSPVAFGFGHPSTISPISAFPLLTQASTSRLPTQPLAFGSVPGQGIGPTGSPKRQRPSPIGYKSAPSLKRTRKSSSSSDSAPPSPRNSLNYDLARGKDELSVGSLGIKDDADRGMTGRKVPKRLRSEIAGTAKSDVAQDQDVGVLLATLPQSSHLPILMNLIRKHPSLIPDVLADLPQPDLDECLAQLERIVTRVRRKTGSSTIVLDQARAWARIQDDVSTYCRTASTYISFFTSPPSSAPPPDPATLQALLFAITSQVYSLLQLVPSDTHSTPLQTLLELGKSLVATWTTWVTAISQEVNQRGGMYPRSLVEGWATNLGNLAQHQSLSSFSSFGSTPPTSHPLVESFRSALVPILEKFITDLGWLIDRRPSFTSIPTPQPVQPPTWGNFRPVPAGIGNQYDEL